MCGVIILAIDPGPEDSTWVAYDPQQASPVLSIGTDALNECLRDWLGGNIACLANPQQVVCEDIESFGMAVGRETFGTVRWTGVFQEVCRRHLLPFALLRRSQVKNHLCHAVHANDAAIRMALLDRFGPGKAKAVGLKKSPGPLFGIAGHAWSALAIAVTWCDLHEGETP